MQSDPLPEPERQRLVAMFIAQRYGELEDRARLLIEHYPESGFGWKALGLSLMIQGKNSLRAWQLTADLLSEDAEVHLNLGTALRDLGRPTEGLASYRRAIEIKPDFAIAHNNLGGVLKDLGRLDDAVASYSRALEIQPDYAEAHINLGVALMNLGRHDDAVASYCRALQSKPDHADAHWNLSFCRLLTGDFGRGWQGYEWRWETEPQSSKRPSFTQPLWLGEVSVKDKTILLHCEQGLGDTIQFCRYASLVADLGARVLLVVQPSLLALLADLSGVAQLASEAEALPAFDYHCPLLSLPLAFKTTLETIPAPRRYLGVDAQSLGNWGTRLGAKSRPRVGLVWCGNPSHKNDRKRSIALAQLVKYLPAHCQYVSLQQEVRDADRDTLAARPDILHFGDALRDFADTAALCEQMDVIISVDTSVAHLAGALGKTVWILLPWVPDWRWLLDRQDSPWYPAARLYRQDRLNDWNGVIERVAADLQRLLNEPRGN